MTPSGGYTGTLPLEDMESASIGLGRRTREIPPTQGAAGVGVGVGGGIAGSVSGVPLVGPYAPSAIGVPPGAPGSLAGFGNPAYEQLQKQLDDERVMYKKRMQEYQEIQQRQAQLVQKLQTKVSFYSPFCFLHLLIFYKDFLHHR